MNWRNTFTECVVMRQRSRGNVEDYTGIDDIESFHIPRVQFATG